MGWYLPTHDLGSAIHLVRSAISLGLMALQDVAGSTRTGEEAKRRPAIPVREC